MDEHYGKGKIKEMSDSEFLTFLYSERDRENAISEYHGWTTWALVGAFFAVAFYAYNAYKQTHTLDLKLLTCYVTGMLAYVGCYKYLEIWLKRERGYDITRVRITKDVAPWTEMAFSLISSVTAVILHLVYVKNILLVILWGVVLFCQMAVFVSALFNRNKLVPCYWRYPFLCNRIFNICFELFVGFILCNIGTCSFRISPFNLMSPEFEMSVYLSILFVLLYFISYFILDNRVVNHFDEIVDNYIYVGTSKEETCNAILCNRMGYGVLDACRKELKDVQDDISQYEQECVALKDIRSRIKSGEIDVYQIPVFRRKMDKELKNLNESLMKTEKLSDRLNEVVTCAPVLNQVSDISYILDANKKSYDVINRISKDVEELSSELFTQYREFYCQKIDGYCPDKKCTHRFERKNVILSWLFHLKHIIGRGRGHFHIA